MENSLIRTSTNIITLARLLNNWETYSKYFAKDYLPELIGDPDNQFIETVRDVRFPNTPRTLYRYIQVDPSGNMYHDALYPTAVLHPNGYLLCARLIEYSQPQFEFVYVINMADIVLEQAMTADGEVLTFCDEYPNILAKFLQQREFGSGSPEHVISKLFRDHL